MIFLVCIIFHPEVQRKIHEELDRIVGDDRLPTHEDRGLLHYIQAAWKESQRWRPTAPISVYTLFTQFSPSQNHFRLPSCDYRRPNESRVLDAERYSRFYEHRVKNIRYGPGY